MDKENENIRELTGKQMEKVSGGQGGSDCFICPGHNKDGTECKHSLQQVLGKKYRCTNAFCDLFFKDQYPMGK